MKRCVADTHVIVWYLGVRADIERARDVRLLRDPNDRLIVGAALRLGVPLLTADARVTESGVVPVVWG